jgi:lipopolysaccharide export system permease protein
MLFAAIGAGVWLIRSGVVIEPPAGLLEAINKSNARLARLFGRAATA